MKSEIRKCSDASRKAYTGTVYVRVVNTDSSIKTMLLMSNSKVTPLNMISGLRPELCGAILSVKMMIYVKISLNSDAKMFT